MGALSGRPMSLIVVDCEAPAGVGAPSVGDMTEFGAVDALQAGRLESFHGTDCSETTFRRFGEWRERRKPVVFVSDNPAYDFQWIQRRPIGPTLLHVRGTRTCQPSTRRFDGADTPVCVGAEIQYQRLAPIAPLTSAPEARQDPVPANQSYVVPAFRRTVRALRPGRRDEYDYGVCASLGHCSHRGRRTEHRRRRRGWPI
jgi:hypothetical protein